MTGPGLDVIVPCYNYGRYLPACVGSVLAETRLPIRVLIIDDASTDGSAAVARRLAAEDRRVSFVGHATNQGHIATYNEGIDWLEQRYMLLLSADDLVAPGALMRAVDLMEKMPRVAFVHGHAVRFSQPEDLARAQATPWPTHVVIREGLSFIRERCATPLNPVHTPTAVVRTAVQKRIGGYAPQLPHAGDMEMWLRCAAEGQVAEIGALQGLVRIHEANMHHGYAGARVLEDYRQRRDAFAFFFAHQRRRLPGARRLQRTAYRNLALELLWEASRAVETGQSAKAMMAFAREMWPGVQLTPRYLKVAAKRRLWTVLANRAGTAAPVRALRS